MQIAIYIQCHTGPYRESDCYIVTQARQAHTYSNMQMQTDLQRLTEAYRDRQRNSGSCIEMHRQLDRQRDSQTETDREIDRIRQRQSETVRDRQRQTERNRDRQRQSETGRERQRQAEADIHTDLHTGTYRDFQTGALRGN